MNQIKQALNALDKATPGDWSIDKTNPDGWLDIISDNGETVIGDQGIQNDKYLGPNADLFVSAKDMAAWINEAVPWLEDMRERLYDSDRERLDALLARVKE